MSTDKARVILSPGSGPIPDFPKGTKVTFDFKTIKVNEDGQETVIDDSKKYKKPMELIIGKQFKLKVWEECVTTMRVGEISRFNVHQSLVVNYPFVSQAYRKYAGISGPNSEEGHEHRPHCCGMSQTQTTGFADLDDLQKSRTDLQFIIELVQVQQPDKYQKEIWQMEDEEKIDSVPKLREEGNALYKQGKFEAACEKYGAALGIIEQLILKEKPGEEEWHQLDRMKIPLLSNYAQCKLQLNDYYSAIEHFSEVIKRDPNNVKAYFRRAKAHAKVWNITEAREDYEKVKELDASLETTIANALRDLELSVRKKDQEDKARLRGKLFT